MKRYPAFAMTDHQLEALWPVLAKGGFAVWPVSTAEARRVLAELSPIPGRDNPSWDEGGAILKKSGEHVFVWVDLARVNAGSLPEGHYEVEAIPLPYRWRAPATVLELLAQIDAGILAVGGTFWP